MKMGFASIGTFLAGVLAEAVRLQWSIGRQGMILALIFYRTDSYSTNTEAGPANNFRAH